MEGLPQNSSENHTRMCKHTHTHTSVSIYDAGREGHDNIDKHPAWPSRTGFVPTGTWRGPSLSAYRYLALRSRIQSRILAVQIEVPQAGELYLSNIDLKHSSLERALYVTQGFVCILCDTESKEQVATISL